MVTVNHCCLKRATKFNFLVGILYCFLVKRICKESEIKIHLLPKIFRLVFFCLICFIERKKTKLDLKQENKWGMKKNLKVGI